MLVVLEEIDAAIFAAMNGLPIPPVILAAVSLFYSKSELLSKYLVFTSRLGKPRDNDCKEVLVQSKGASGPITNSPFLCVIQSTS